MAVDSLGRSIDDVCGPQWMLLDGVMRWMLFLVSAYALAQTPKFTREPEDLKLVDGTAFLLMVSATAVDAYQWWKDGDVIVGATNYFLAEDVAVEADAGRYWVVASNKWGWKISRVATVTFSPYVRFFSGNRQVKSRVSIFNGLRIRLVSSPKKTIYYTLDGSEPTSKSAVYVDQIAVSRPLMIRVMVDGVEYAPLNVVPNSNNL